MKKIYPFLLAFSAFVLPVNAQIMYTIAGCDGCSTGDGNPAITTTIGSPWAITTDDAGNIYYSEPGTSVVRKIDHDGIISTVAGTGTAGYSGNGGPATAAQLNTPYGLATDHAGNLYIADNKNNVIRKVNAAGMISTVAGTGIGIYTGDGGPASAASLYEPFDVAVDKSGNLYISDAGNMAIRRVSPAGTINTLVGGFDATLTGGAYGYTGELWFPSNRRLSGIAVDTSGNVYIADYWDNIIRKVTPAGVMTRVGGDMTLQGFAGDGGSAMTASLDGPKRIAVDHKGNILFSDLNNNRIRSISPSGTITTIAGNGYGGLMGDGGPATNATLSYPIGVALDASDNLYIADSHNNRIRKVNWGTTSINAVTTSNNIVVTLAPDPNNGTFTIKGTSDNDAAVAIEVINVDGRVVYQHTIVPQSGKVEEQISIGNDVPNGMYLLKLSNGASATVSRFVIERL